MAGELVARADYPGQLNWLPAVLIVVGVLAALALIAFSARVVRLAAIGGALAALLIAPSVWAFDTLGHATSGTFPAGGPASAETMGGGPGGGFGGLSRRLGAGSGGGAAQQLFGPGGAGPGASTGSGGPTAAGSPAVVGPGATIRSSSRRTAIGSAERRRLWRFRGRRSGRGRGLRGRR